MSNIPVIINRDTSVFYGNTVRASRQLQTPRITDIDGGNNPLLMANNVITTNDFAQEAGHDGGVCVERYQTSNDAGTGDVVNDVPPAETGTSQSHSGLSKNQIALDAGTSSVANDFYNSWFIRITSGLHLDQVRQVIDYVGATKVASVGSPWTPIVITGTVSTSATSTTVTGVGTLFTTELAVGDTIVIGNETKEIAGITNNVTLDTVTPYNSTNINISATLINPSGGVTFDLFNRRSTCLFWDESAKKWQLAFSVDKAGSTITIIDYADLCVGSVEVTSDLLTPGISFDGGVNVLSTYIDWTAVTVSSLIPALNTVTDDSNSVFEQVGNKVTLRLNLFFDQLILLGGELFGIFNISGAPPASSTGVSANTTLISQAPPPFSSVSGMVSMIPGTNFMLLRAVGGSLPVASHRIFGELIYQV